MKTIKQLIAEFNQTNPVPGKAPKKFFEPEVCTEPRPPLKMTKKALAWEEKQRAYDTKLEEFLWPILDKQIEESGQKRLDRDYIMEWYDDEIHGRDNEENLIDAIQRDLLTPEQRLWLNQHNYSIHDLLNGRTRADQEEIICNLFYKPWNDILEANGITRSFNEDLMCEAMIDFITKTLGPVEFK